MANVVRVSDLVRRWRFGSPDASSVDLASFVVSLRFRNSAGYTYTADGSVLASDADQAVIEMRQELEVEVMRCLLKLCPDMDASITASAVLDMLDSATELTANVLALGSTSPQPWRFDILEPGERQ